MIPLYILATTTSRLIFVIHANDRLLRLIPKLADRTSVVEAAETRAIP
jgi:hypothetical protein